MSTPDPSGAKPGSTSTEEGEKKKRASSAVEAKRGSVGGGGTDKRSSVDAGKGKPPAAGPQSTSTSSDPPATDNARKKSSSATDDGRRKSSNAASEAANGQRRKSSKRGSESHEMDDKLTGPQRLAALKQKKLQKRAEELQQVAEMANEEEEEETTVPLLDRRDSELTAAEILQKDLMMYDLLMEHEELMLMHGEIKPVVAEEEEEEEGADEEEDDEEEDEQEEEAEDEVVEEAEPDADADDQAPMDNPDDPDNIVNLMMQDQQDMDDAIKLLFMDTGPIEQEPDSVINFPGVVGITLSDKSKEFFEIGDLAEKEPSYTYISCKRIKLHLYMYQDQSEFAEHYKLFEHYPDFAMLIGLDPTQQTGHPYFLCTTIESRNLVINPPKKKRVVLDAKKKEEEVWAKMASITPRKWRTLGSELEVDIETIRDERPLKQIFAYRYIEGFGNPIQFERTRMERDSMAFTSFPSVDPATIKLVEEAEVDIGIQVMPPKATSSSQTGFSFKRNKIIQYESQFVSPEEAQRYLDSPVELKRTKSLQRSLLQNELMNMIVDDYKTLKAVKGHEVEYNNESVLLQEYQTYCDLRHSKGRYVTCMTFHPMLEDVVVMAMAEDATFDRRIEFHSKMLMEPNFVLFWDLKDPVKPQLMLDAPADVFTFMINPADASLIAGGCANGQIVLWDLGRLYSELKARIQDRRHKSKDMGKRKPSFLEKLKDNAEKYVCPLVPVSGLSNLDQSHKRVVTSVCWLPPHVELGKNGTLYENSTGGKSVQFFSSAGDGTLRLWDIRPPKLGLDEFDAVPDQDIIRSNMWVHLENNSWKYSAKYMLDDGRGTMYSCLMSISEPKQGDVIKFDATAHRESLASDSSGLNLASSSKDINKSTSGGIPASPVTSKKSHINIGASSTQVRSGSIIGGEGPGVDVDSISAASRRAAGMLNVLSTAQTSIFVGTEMGQTVLCDWLRNKDGTINQDQGQRVCQNVFLETVHDGAITCISRSPFYYNLILVVGGGSVSIWKENSGHPLLATAGSEFFPWCGCWSNTRPAVFFVGTREGALQVWDLTEKSHSPVLTQQISPERLTNISIPKPKLAKKQILALSDATGNLFVMLLSRYYYKPTQFENSFMQELMNREEGRLKNWITEAEARDETIHAINSKWKESRITKKAEEVAAMEEEEENRLNADYSEYLEFQFKIAARMKRDEPTVSTSTVNLAEDFSALLEAAKEKDQELREAGELSDDNSTSSLGSDYDFLHLTHKEHEGEADESPSSDRDDYYMDY